jgi:hypothetical protein
MDYCTLPDVLSLLQNITINNTSKPNETEVRGWIRDVSENIVDSMLSTLMDVPVTDTRGQGYLKMVVSNRIAAMVLMSLEADAEKVEMYMGVFTRGMKEAQAQPGMLFTDGNRPRPALRSSFTTREPKYRREEQDW